MNTEQAAALAIGLVIAAAVFSIYTENIKSISSAQEAGFNITTPNRARIGIS